MAKKESTSIPASHLKRYEQLLESYSDIERKGAKTPYTSVNGNMFSFMTETGVLAIRLGEEQRESFLKKFRSRLCERHGTVMKEYVEVPTSLLKKTAELKVYFDQSVCYAHSLKAKPTTRKKNSGAKKKKSVKKPVKASVKK